MIAEKFKKYVVDNGGKIVVASTYKELEPVFDLDRLDQRKVNIIIPWTKSMRYKSIHGMLNRIIGMIDVAILRETCEWITAGDELRKDRLRAKAIEGWKCTRNRYTTPVKVGRGWRYQHLKGLYFKASGGTLLITNDEEAMMRYSYKNMGE